MSRSRYYPGSRRPVRGWIKTQVTRPERREIQRFIRRLIVEQDQQQNTLEPTRKPRDWMGWF